MKSMLNLRAIFCLAVTILSSANASGDSGYKDKGGYYKVAPAFNPHPKANDKKGWLIKNFGPVGIGINLKAPGMTMEIANVEEGSPAEKAGKLEKGQIIESINGVEMTGADPRLVLAKLITDAEATDGEIELQIKGLGRVAVTIPVMGSYSPTWPLNCPKSDKIVRNMADLVAKEGKGNWGSVLFLLSTGEEKDLAVVREWMKTPKESFAHNWDVGYRGIGICEYYLRTGDKTVLPLIKEGADQLRDSIYNGAWSGRKASYTYQSGGQLNAAGVHCLTFLLLAKTCGVDVDEATLISSLEQFYRFSGRGSVPYGNYTPKAGFTDCNGKTSGLAIAMVAASRLTPEGEKSIYAQAAQVNSMKSFYGTNDFNVGHTGGGIGEIWKSATMAQMTDKRPDTYHSYMDARQWTLELSRRFDGGIGVAGGAEGNYDKSIGEHSIPWGTYYALSYTLPRKHLHLFGATRSEWAKSFTLPERPWGTAADDAFSSPFPVPGGPLDPEDLLMERVGTHAGQPVRELLADGQASDLTIRIYLHHPEITYRHYALGKVLDLKKDDMLLAMLKSEDARLQHMGVMGLHELLGTWRKEHKAAERVTDEMWGLVEGMIRNPEGSWCVKQWAMGLLQHKDLEYLRTFKDLLAELILHEEHWLQGSAISASRPLLADPQSYKQMFPPIVEAIQTSSVYSIVTRAREITEGLDEAPPEIRDYALKMLKPVYLELPSELVSDSGIYVIPGGGAVKRASIGQVLGFSEEGQEFLNSQPKMTSAWKISGRDEDKFVFGGSFEPNPDLVGKWALVDHKLLKNKQEAEAFIRESLAKNKVPSPKPKKINYGFQLKEGSGKISVLGFHSTVYGKNIAYSGNMAFKTFVDQAYRFEIFPVEGRDYLMMESDFEPERDKGYVPVYKAFVRVSE